MEAFDWSFSATFILKNWYLSETLCSLGSAAGWHHFKGLFHVRAGQRPLELSCIGQGRCNQGLGACITWTFGSARFCWSKFSVQVFFSELRVLPLLCLTRRWNWWTRSLILYVWLSTASDCIVFMAQCWNSTELYTINWCVHASFFLFFFPCNAVFNATLI